MRERDVVLSNDQWRVAVNENENRNLHESYFGLILHVWDKALYT